jgi:hypothetical protein
MAYINSPSKPQSFTDFNDVTSLEINFGVINEVH